MLCDVIPI